MWFCSGPLWPQGVLSFGEVGGVGGTRMAQGNVACSLVVFVLGVDVSLFVRQRGEVEERKRMVVVHSSSTGMSNEESLLSLKGRPRYILQSYLRQ